MKNRVLAVMLCEMLYYVIALVILQGTLRYEVHILAAMILFTAGVMDICSAIENKEG